MQPCAAERRPQGCSPACIWSFCKGQACSLLSCYFLVPLSAGDGADLKTRSAGPNLPWVLFSEAQCNLWLCKEGFCVLEPLYLSDVPMGKDGGKGITTAPPPVPCLLPQLAPSPAAASLVRVRRPHSPTAIFAMIFQHRCFGERPTHAQLWEPLKHTGFYLESKKQQLKSTRSSKLPEGRWVRDGGVMLCNGRK